MIPRQKFLTIASRYDRKIKTIHHIICVTYNCLLKCMVQNFYIVRLPGL